MNGKFAAAGNASRRVAACSLFSLEAVSVSPEGSLVSSRGDLIVGDAGYRLVRSHHPYRCLVWGRQHLVAEPLPLGGLVAASPGGFPVKAAHIDPA